MVEAVRFKFLPESLAVDVAEMDAEHEGIFQMLAHLKNRSLGAVPFTLELAESILARLRQHFATEERLAREVDEDFAEHAHKHEFLLRTVSELLTLTLRGDGNVFSLLRYIEYWCERHIGEEDRPLAARLKTKALMASSASL